MFPSPKALLDSRASSLRDFEKKARETIQKEFAAAIAETQAREAARQAILDRLGLTADEAKLLLG